MGLGYYRGRDSKYNAKPTRCLQGIMHHSKMECRRCDELHLLQTAGLIRDLHAHPQRRFDLRVQDMHVTTYVADFSYTDCETGEEVVEDVKGHATAEYKLKRALMLACLGIDVREVRRVR